MRNIIKFYLLQRDELEPERERVEKLIYQWHCAGTYISNISMLELRNKNILLCVTYCER